MHVRNPYMFEKTFVSFQYLHYQVLLVQFLLDVQLAHWHMHVCAFLNGTRSITLSLQWNFG